MTNEIKNSERPHENPVQQPTGYFIPMPSQSHEEDEIDLFELWQVIWNRRWMVMGITCLFAVVSVMVSLMLPNIYRAEVLLAPVSEESKGSMASALGGLGGFASLAGISMGSGGGTEENLAVLKSREFLWAFIDENKLMPILFEKEWDSANERWLETDKSKQPTLWDAYRKFTKEVFYVSSDKKSGLITIATEWVDPELAAQWANELVVRLNSFLRAQAISRSENNLKYLNDELIKSTVSDMRQTLYEIIAKEQKTAMLANTQIEFAFRVIDAAVEPDKKSKPKRSLIVALATIVGGIFSIILAFIMNIALKRKEV